MQNCILFGEIIKGASLEELLEKNLLYLNYTASNKNKFYTSLQLRKYIQQLPKKYKAKLGLRKLEQYISGLDDTVFTGGIIGKTEIAEVSASMQRNTGLKDKISTNMRNQLAKMQEVEEVMQYGE